MNKGPLVRVQIGPNRFAKMHEQDAIARGLIEKPKKKQRKPVADKMRRPSKDKAKVDDLTAIPGIGKATAERLQQLGLTTFDQLRTADLSGLPARTRQAIEVWRK